MPILRKEIEIAPEEIFSLPAALPWLVAHVRSRQEKMLARFLVQRGIAFYLPQTSKAISSGGRMRTSHLPLFPGYVFFRADAAGRDAVMRSDLAVSLLTVEDQELLGRQLQQLRELQLAGASLLPLEDFEPGDSVRIRDGAFAGYTGVVERGGRGERLIVSISLLRKSLAVEFERERLRNVRPPA